MNARLHQSTEDILKNFIPLNTLSGARLNSICDECHIEECAKGTVLFEQGDDAKEFIYLISGMVGLYAGEMEVETVVTGSEVARFAIAHHIPRKVKAVTKSKARIVRIATYLLDMDRPEDISQTYMVDEVEEQGGDWMTTMLQSPVFQRLPASNLQKVMMKMEEIAFESGEVVVKQGDEADYYYIIKTGDCELIRQPSEGARPVKLAELHSCDAFGEDALLSGNPRNVTVRMKGKGQMLRLSKANFIALVKEPVLQYVNYDEGLQKVDAGANWLDVRSVDEYANGHIDGGVNIPFFSLRMKISDLRHDQLQVLVCEKGRTSEAAAFLLLKFGFNALILKGGMAGLSKSVAASNESATISPDAELETVAAKSGEQASTAASDQQHAERLKESQSKIMALEKLCAQSNEQLNKLELERNGLQQQNEQQSNLVAKLQASSQLVDDELALSQRRNKERDEEVTRTLLAEKEKNTALTLELEGKLVALSQARQELAGFAEQSGNAEKGFNDLAADLVVKDEELGELKAALINHQEKGKEAAERLQTELSGAKQEVAELIHQKELLDNGADKARREIDALSEAKADLEQKIEQLGRDSIQSHSKNEGDTQLLNAQLSELRSSLAGSEQSQEATKSNLLEVEAELDQTRESSKAAEGKLQADLDAERKEFDDERDVLTQQLKERAGVLEKEQERIKSLEGELQSLGDDNRSRNTVLSEKEADIAAFTQQLNEAEIVTLQLNQQYSDLESALSEKEGLLAHSAEELAKVISERDTSLGEIEQLNTGLLSLSSEQTELKDQLSTALLSVEELREKEGDLVASSDSWQQRYEKVEADLGATAKELDDSCEHVRKLEQDSEVLRQQVVNVEDSLNAVTSGKETLESELTQRLSEAKLSLENALESKAVLAQQLGGSTKEKEADQQAILELKNQLETGLDEQRLLTEQLDQVRKELDETVQSGNVEKEQLSQSLQQAKSRFDETQAVLNEQSQQLVADEQSREQQIAELEHQIKLLLDNKVQTEQALEELMSSKEEAQQALLLSQRQVDEGRHGQQQLNEQLSQAGQKLSKANQEGEAELGKLSEALQQAQVQLQAAELSLVEQAKQAESVRIQQLSELESELEKVQGQKKSSAEDLVSAQAEIDALQQKMLDVETALSGSTGDQKALLEEIDKARVESAEHKEMLGSKQTEIDAAVNSKIELEEALALSKQALEQAQLANERTERRCAELSNNLDDQSSEQQTEGGLFKEQLAELDSKLQQSKAEVAVLSDKLQTTEFSLSTAANEKEKTILELDQLKQGQVSDKDDAKVLQQKIDSLEQSLKRSEEEKQQTLANAGKDNDDKVGQLSEQLLAAQDEARSSLKRVDEIVASQKAEEKAKEAIEEKLLAADKENANMRRRIADVERKASKDVENQVDETRIKELEKQLDEASTMLLDLEIKMESASVDVNEEPSEEENNELKALQSELNLVREQTEKDIQAMQAKVENSEKMNLALKKKILSMQTLANQDVLVEEPTKEKKKSWWK